MDGAESGPPGQRYAALLLFQFRVVAGGVSDRRRLCERRLVLLHSADARSALRLAKRRGRESQYRYKNAQNGTVRFEFIGVLELLHLGPECEPDEVWYELGTMMEPMERRDRLVPDVAELQAIAVERGRSRPTDPTVHIPAFPPLTPGPPRSRRRRRP